MNIRKRHTVVLIVCDAIRWDYLNSYDTPFLIELANKGIYIRKIRPSLGFCERVEMFTGARPEDSGYFTAFTFDKHKSDFKILSNNELKLLKILRKISYIVGYKMKLSKKIIDNLIRLYLIKFRNITQPLYEIPTVFLKEISLTEDFKNMYVKNGLNIESIFDIMVAENKTFLYDTFASLRMWTFYSDDRRIRVFLRKVRRKHYDLCMLYLGEGDGVGHFYGPDSTERRIMTRKLDRRIRNIVFSISKIYPKAFFIILGDHGMVAVNRYVNAFLKIIKWSKKYNLIMNKDYKFFLDSTMIRIWTKCQKARKAFSTMFNMDTELINLGFLLDEKKIKFYHLPKRIEYYGDFIWLAKPGVVIYPDFFHVIDKVKGMHGYDPHFDEQKGFAILYSCEEYLNSKEIEERELIDICPTLCDLLDIRYPKMNKGMSILQ